MNRFDEINRQIKVMQDAGLTDSPIYERLLSLALEAAPDSLKSAIMDLAIQEGRLPPPMGVDANGERLWRLEDIASHFGLSAEEAKLSLADFQEEHGTIPPIDIVHRLH